MRINPQLLGHYHVYSETQAETMYDVELLANNGNGRCTCQDWQMRIGPYLERSEDPPRRFCKHIIACREYFLDDVIKRMIAASLVE